MYTLHNLAVHYRYTTCTFPNLHITAQGITYIVGDNGSGKSTLLRILSGLQSPNSGYISYKGNVISKKKLHVLHQETTLLLQNSYLFNRSVRANLAYPLSIRKQPYDEGKLVCILEEVGLHSDILNKYPYELSGGERQRVALAVRLLVNANVLLLDEPNSNIDAVSMIIIEELIKKIASTTKIILVAHNATWAERLATEIISL